MFLCYWCGATKQDVADSKTTKGLCCLAGNARAAEIAIAEMHAALKAPTHRQMVEHSNRSDIAAAAVVTIYYTMVNFKKGED